MLRVFGANDTTFTSNGDIVLKPFRAKVHKADNSDYYLDLECSLDYINYVIEDNIIVANTPQGDQAFRIKNVTKTKRKITAQCPHVFFDCQNIIYWRDKRQLTNITCSRALQEVFEGSTGFPQSWFPWQISTDITDTHTMTFDNSSVYELVMKIVDLWGGHLVRDNFNIGIMSQIGTDNQITIQYKKNIKEITCEENWEDVVSAVMPVGKDSLKLNALSSGVATVILSTAVNLPLYDIPYTKVIRIDQDIEREDYPSDEAYFYAIVQDLYEKGKQYIRDNYYPKVNYSLKAHIDRIVDIGDIIEVIDDRLGVHVLTNVISYEYDCILEKYTDIEFNNFGMSASGLGKVVNKTAQNNRVGIIGGKQLVFNPDNTISWKESN